MTDTPRIVATLADDLRAAGIRAGDCLLVQSSFKALGLPSVTPDDVITTLLAVLGAEGTVMMPTFTYSYAGIFNVQPFHPAKTPGMANGILTETLRRYPGALRSAHPTYSVAAVGRHAARLTEEKATASAMGYGSSLDEAYQLDATILLLGVGNNRNSMLHYAEVAAGLPYHDIPHREFWGRTALVEQDGDAVEVPLHSPFPACSLNFGAADAYLIDRDIARRAAIGQAASLVMSTRAMVDAVAERLRREPAWLLCDLIVCEPCNRRKHLLRELGML